MTPEQKEISNAFLEGMQELFNLMFTQNIKLCFLDEENTDTNFYKESEQKKYLEAINIAGKLVIDTPHLDDPKMGTEKKLTLTIPAKEFIDKGLELTPESYDKFLKAKIVFEGVDYYIKTFKPKTLIAEVYRFYEITCSDRDTYWVMVSGLKCLVIGRKQG